MGCISDYGTDFAARIWDWRTGRARRIGALLLLPVLLAADDPAPTSGAVVDVTVTGLRSAKGLVRACLTRDPHFFPDCAKDPASLSATVQAGPDARLRFTHVATGDYALAILHDENANARADMLLGIPREGVGFSENPRIRFGPPKFDAARFRVDTRPISQVIRMKYFL